MENAEQAVQELRSLLARYLAVYETLEEVLIKTAEWTQEHEEPPERRVFDSPEELIDYLDKRHAYAQGAKEMAAKVSASKEAKKELEKKLLSRIPIYTWVRYGDHGVGHAYTDWGGSSHYLIVQAWADDMPSLDHKYHGA